MGKKEEWKEAILNALFPPRCILCDELTESGREEICPSCKAYEKRMEEPICKKCGRGILLDTEEYCGNCKRHRFSFSTGMMLYELTEEVEDALVLLKYKGRKDKGIFFGKRSFSGKDRGVRDSGHCSCSCSPKAKTGKRL